MSTAVAEPEAVTSRSTDVRRIHWVCLRQLDNLPLVALCGDLPPRQLRNPGRVSCPDCLGQVFPHAATCALCAPHTGKYR